MKKIKLIIIIFPLILVVSGCGVNNFNQPFEKKSIPKVDESKIKEDVNTSKTNDIKADMKKSGAILDLSDSGLEKLSQDIFKKTDLVELNVSGNKLTGALPGEIRFLKNLKILNVSNNSMTAIPAEVGQLSDLEILNYANNDITGIPLEIGNLGKLKILNLSGNKFSEYDLDLILKQLPNLKVIK